MARKDDPMSGLLSNLDGIDSNLFKQHQSMSAQKKAKASSATTSGPPRPSPGASNTSSTSFTATSTPSAVKPMGMATTGAQPSKHPTSMYSTSQQRDAFSGLDDVMMGSNRAPASTPPAPPRPPSYDSLTVQPTGPAPINNNATLGNDLDFLFGSTSNAAPPIPAASNSDLGFDFGISHHPPPQPSGSSMGDLLGTSSSGIRPTAPTTATSGSVHSDLDLFGQPSAVGSSTGGQPGGAAEEYADIFTRIRSKEGAPPSPRTHTTTTAPPTAMPSFEKPASVKSRTPSQASAIHGDARDAQEAPPLGSSPVIGGRGSSTNAAPVGSSSVGYFDRFGDDEQRHARRASDPLEDEEEGGPPPPAYDAVVPHTHDWGASNPNTMQLPQSAAEVKKQAEKIGKWLAGGARKLAKAAQQKAKEVQANLSEMDMAGRVKPRPSGHSPYGERMDSDDEGGHAGGGVSGGDSGRYGGNSNAGGFGGADHGSSSAHGGNDGGHGRNDNSYGMNGSGRPRSEQQQRGQDGLDDLPEHYYEWAATLAQIQHASDQRQVLDGMPEDERRVLVRLMKQQGMADPYDEGLPRRPSSAPTPPSPRASQDLSRPPLPAAKPAPTGPVQHAQPQADLLGLSTDGGGGGGRGGGRGATTTTTASQNTTASAKPPPTRPAPAVVDLLGVHDMTDTPPGGGGKLHTPHPTPAASSNNLDDFFGGGGGTASHTATSSHTTYAKEETDFSAMFGEGPSSGARGGGVVGDAMIDFGLDDMGETPAEFAELYAGEQGDDNEPELRKQARARRLAAMHARMREKLAAKLEQEQAEADEKAEKVRYREQYKPAIDAWSNQKKDNIRALLSTMHSVMWEGSGWKQPSMADIVDAQKVKRWYMKANLVVHPDKVKQKGGTVEQLTIADMVFDVLKQAWAKFEASELR